MSLSLLNFWRKVCPGIIFLIGSCCCFFFFRISEYTMLLPSVLQGHCFLQGRMADGVDLSLSAELCWPRGGADMSKVKLLSLTISDCFFSISFSPEVLQFFTRFCNSYLIIALLMFLWGNKDWDSLLCHLADIIDKIIEIFFLCLFFSLWSFPIQQLFHEWKR